jgi:hypothetical protein
VIKGREGISEPFHLPADRLLIIEIEWSAVLIGESLNIYRADLPVAIYEFHNKIPLKENAVVKNSHR